MANQAQFLTLITVECLATNDLTGDDELIGRFGDLVISDFPIGQFNSGQKINLNIEKLIPVGVTNLSIIEKDLTGDDLIGVININEQMSIENEITLKNDSAEYIVRYVISEGN